MLDGTFNFDGKVLTDFGSMGDMGKGMDIQSDGKIVVCGNTETGMASHNFALARYNVDGSLDGSFGVNGKVITAIGLLNNEGANVIKIQPDGKILVAGSTDGGITYSDYALARYNADGSLNSAF